MIVNYGSATILLARFREKRYNYDVSIVRGDKKKEDE
jgi:hypothetical protein